MFLPRMSWSLPTPAKGHKRGVDAPRAAWLKPITRGTLWDYATLVPLRRGRRDRVSLIRGRVGGSSSSGGTLSAIQASQVPKSAALAGYTADLTGSAGSRLLRSTSRLRLALYAPSQVHHSVDASRPLRVSHKIKVSSDILSFSP